VVAVNPDFPLGRFTPGVFLSIDPGAGAALGADPRRAFLLGHKQSSGTAALNQPVQITSETDAINRLGRRSDLARGFRALTAQVGPGAVPVWVVPVPEPSGGVASRYQITFTGTATSPGYRRIYVCGYPCDVAIADGDAASTVAIAALAQLQAQLDTPITWTRSGAVLTGVYVHAGAVGEDLPIRIDSVGGVGITVSPGVLLFSGTASGAGSLVLSSGAQSVTVAVANSDTAAQIATNAAAALASGDFSPPFTGTVNGSTPAQLDLFFVDERDQRRITARFVTTTGVTINGVAAGSTAYIGTASSAAPGSGTPVLTTALTNQAKLGSFRAWANPFANATSLGDLVSHITTYTGGDIGQQQEAFLVTGSAVDIATAGTLTSSPTPTLASSEDCELSWGPDANVQGWEIACRIAGAKAAGDVITNWDGYTLRGRGAVPTPTIAIASRPDAGSVELALASYHMTPITVDALGQTNIIRSITTATQVDPIFYEPSSAIYAGDFRTRLGARLTDRFGGKSLTSATEIRSSNLFRLEDVRLACIEFAAEEETAGRYTGVESLLDAFQVQRDDLVPTRILIQVPFSPVLPIHQIVGPIQAASQL